MEKYSFPPFVVVNTFNSDDQATLAPHLIGDILVNKENNFRNSDRVKPALCEYYLFFTSRITQ